MSLTSARLAHAPLDTLMGVGDAGDGDGDGDGIGMTTIAIAAVAGITHSPE